MKTNGQLEPPNTEHAGYRVLLAMTSCLALWVALFTFIALPRLGQAENGERGKELFEKRCSGCHALDKEKEGPRLRGVFGRTSGTVPSFKYSDALKAAHTHAIQPRFVRLLTGRWAEPIRPGTRTNRPTL